jgi:hypothetical protein
MLQKFDLHGPSPAPPDEWLQSPVNEVFEISGLQKFTRAQSSAREEGIKS